MYSFMIADDEKAIRESIPKVIDFESYGFSLCDTARDGEEAFNKTKDLHPNLVLLDIRMPKLDGLSYLKELKDYDLEQTKVIILSGYSEFSYAKTALKYGARGYLTKPLDTDELTSLLVEIKEELDEDNQLNNKDSMHKYSENLIKMYHDGNGERSYYKDLCFLHFVILNNNQQNDTLTQISLNLADIFDDKAELFLSKGSIYSFLCKKNCITVQGCKCINETVISHVMNRLSARGIECAVIVDCELFEETGNTFRADFDAHLYTMLTDIFWDEKKDIISYTRFTERKSTDGWKYVKNHVLNLKEAIFEEDKDRAIEYLNLIYEEIKSRRVEFTSVIEIYFRIFYTLRELVITNEDDNISFTAVRWQDSLYFVTYKEMEEHGRSSVMDLIHCLSVTRRNQNLGVGEKAKEYIKNNYSKQIFLKDVADALYINPAYLGRCIQKETGLSFNNYLNELRIEKAKDLLKNTDMMVYEIAKEVGYTESKHFVTKFTSSQGCAPLCYRKKYRKV